MDHVGYATAKHVLSLGRSAFFYSPEAELPQSASGVIRGDDLTPQFGCVGDRYEETKILLFGINPGNGPRDCRSCDDERMMPKLIRFRDDPSEENFRGASAAFAEACWSWPVWRQRCSELWGEGRLSFDQVAFANCLPWRTATGTQFSNDTAERAMRHYALPLICELKPKIVVALYKRAATILEMNGQIARLVRWNGAQAPTASVRLEREDTAREILRRVSG